jgi:hypothetical protein
MGEGVLDPPAFIEYLMVNYFVSGRDSAGPIY